MARSALCIPAAVILFCALVLNFITSISLPYLPGLDIARSRLPDAEVQGTQGISQIRFGIWAPCYYGSNNDRTCLHAGHGYGIEITKGTEVAVINPSWTRGLAVHPVATIATFFAFFFTLFLGVPIMAVIASLVAFLAAILTLIAFAIDIALFALVKFEFNKLGAGITTKTGPGFWLTFASLVLLLIGSCTVLWSCCKGKKRSDSAVPTGNTTEKPAKKPFWKGLKRNQ